MYKGQIENMRINVTIVCSIKNKTLLRGMYSLVGPCFNFFTLMTEKYSLVTIF